MPKTYTVPALPFTRAYLENRDKSMSNRFGLAIRAAAQTRPIHFAENCMLPLVGALSDNDFAGFTYGSGLFVDGGAYQRMKETYADYAEEIDALWRQMEASATGVQYGRHNTPADLRLTETMACWGGSWIGHCNIAFGKLAHVGTDGIRAEIAHWMSVHPEESEFYEGSLAALDALDILGDRIVGIAKESAETETDAQKKAEWERIASTFGHVPRKPARDFYEGVQVYWMLFTTDGIDSPGRFDREMIDLYRISAEADKKPVLRRFLEAIHNVRAWNLCISGSDENWNDETNELSYDILELVTEMQYQTPNLTMRVHRNTPEKLWQMAVQCIGTGIGLPALYNDEVVCPALEKIGIPAADAHDYCMNGCNQIDIMGKSHMGLEDGEVNMAKVLELALHNGYDFRRGGEELISLQTGNPRKCQTFADFLALYYKQLDFITEASVRMSNNAQEMYARYAPNPLRSCFVEGCFEKGRDYKNGGPLYGHGQVLAEGIADAVDSLYAIKKMIFDEKKYTMAALIDALEADFVGYDRLYQDFKNCDKFGNDIDEVDAIAKEITDHFFAYLKTKETFRGGVFTGGCSPFSRAASNGSGVAALPNGKHNGEATFADSIAATPGRDTRGPTASLKSMMCYSQEEACSGFVGQMKFNRDLFNTEKGMAAFEAMAKTYFANGGQQLSINVLDKETLLAAQKCPAEYRNLIVRVGGYSDYFCNLSPDLQQNVIDRATFTV